MKLLPKNKQHLHEIIFLLSAVFVWNCCAYTGARLIASKWYHYDMTTSFDEAIPFIAWTVSIYISWYVIWAVTYYLCALQDRRERDRFFCADAISKLVCFIIFIALPTTNIRPEVPSDGNIWNFLMNLIYTLDSADNLFPSIHCLVSWFCFIGVRKNKNIPIPYRIFTLVAAVLICISTITTKQHVVADVISGIILAELCYAIAGCKKICAVYSSIYSRALRLFKIKSA